MLSKGWQNRALARVVVIIGVVSVAGACSPSSKNAANVEKERVGVGYLIRLVPLTQALQTHRSMAMAFAEGDTLVEFGPIEERIAAGLTTFSRFDQQHSELEGVRERWTPLHKQIRDLIESWRERPRECFELHTELITAALTFATYIGDASTLRLDTNTDVRSLADAATTVIPELGETMGQARDMVATMTGMTGGMGAVVREEEKTLLERQLKSIRTQLDTIKADYEQVYSADEKMRSQLEPQREVVGQVMAPVLDRIEHQVISVEHVTMTPDDWTPKATVAVEAIQALEDKSLAVLQARLNAHK